MTKWGLLADVVIVKQAKGKRSQFISFFFFLCWNALRSLYKILYEIKQYMSCVYDMCEVSYVKNGSACVGDLARLRARAR